MYRVKAHEVLASDATTLDIPIASTATIYTHSFLLEDAQYFAMAILASGTTVNLKVELEQSHKRPTTEGSADTYYSVPENQDDIVSALSAKTYKQYGISPIVNKFGRYKITGGSGNTADVTARIWTLKQGQI